MERLFQLIFICGIAIEVIASSTIREDMTIVRICNATDPVDINIFNNYMMFHNFENNIETEAKHQLACFLLCIYNEHKWMNRHGDFNIHNIRSWMQRTELPENDTEILLKKCITPVLSDPCNRARQFTECFWSNHQGSIKATHRHTLHSIIHRK